MSSTIKCKTSDLKTCFEFLDLMIPKGIQNVPVGIHAANGKVTFTCIQGAVYQCTLTDLSNSVVNCTCLYSNISQLLSSEYTYLEVSEFVVNVYSGSCYIQLSMGYGTVDQIVFEDIDKSAVQPYSYLGLKNLINLGLDKLYRKARPIQIFNDVSLLKYPNTHVQVRSVGMNCERYLDTEHVKLLCKFAPTQISVELTMLTFYNNNAILQLPCREAVDGTTILTLLDEMKLVCTLNLEGYYDKVKNISKVCKSVHCKITVHTAGMSTSVSTSEVNAVASVEHVNSDVVKVLHLPLDIWLTFLKVMNGSTEILLGGDNLCLRNQEYVIVTRVLH